MVKHIDITLPEELIKDLDKFAKKLHDTRSGLIAHLLRDKLYLSQPALTSQEQDEIIKELAGTGEANLGTIPTTATEQTLNVSQPALPPFCEASKFCRSRSTGHFKIITNDGTEEKVLYLCPTHLGLAKREGEVREI